MALVRRLLRLLGRPSNELACVREAMHPRYGVLVRSLSSPAASEVEKSSEGGHARAEVEGGLERKPWTPQSRRTGAIAVKLGMTQLWDDLGEAVPATVLQVYVLMCYMISSQN